jgi:hypothetical protein
MSALVAMVALMSQMSSASAANFLSADVELLAISFARDSRVVFFAAIYGEYTTLGAWCTPDRRRDARRRICKVETVGNERRICKAVRELRRGVERPLWRWFLTFARRRQAIVSWAAQRWWGALLAALLLAWSPLFLVRPAPEAWANLAGRSSSRREQGSAKRGAVTSNGVAPHTRVKARAASPRCHTSG